MALSTRSEGDHAYEEEITESFTIEDIKGAIIAPVLEGTGEIEHLFRLKMMNFPFILLENVKSIQSNVANIDDIRVMKEALKYSGQRPIQNHTFCRTETCFPHLRKE